MTEKTNFEMLDITAPKGPVQIDIKSDGKVIWINVEGICVLRICQIEKLEITDQRKGKIK